MAGGASSRMKRSLSTANLDSAVLQAAKNMHKSLIPLGESGQPMLYYLLGNAVKSGIQQVYIITSEENVAFHDFMEGIKNDEALQQLEIKFAIQYIPEGREKPLGTADAVQQCLEQHPNLQKEQFTVCNGDNLYSATVMGLLRQERKAPHATIAYSGSGLGFDDERLSRFAVMDMDAGDYLQQIIEKPEIQEMEAYRDSSGELSISMNIFNFSGAAIYPYLVHCPIHPERNEKELPETVRNAITDNPGAMFCHKVSELLPDLTSAADIKKMNLYL